MARYQEVEAYVKHETFRNLFKCTCLETWVDVRLHRFRETKFLHLKRHIKTL